MPLNQLTPAGQNELGAAFGYYPSMGKRRVQDPVGATEVPLQMLRGRVAGTLGLPSDVLNTVRSPMPMEAFGDVDYSQMKLVPYGTSQLLKELPLKPTSRVGEVAGEIGSVAPITPMEALQAARLARQAALAGDRAAMAVGKAGERYAERVVPQIMARGGMPAQLLSDLGQGSRRQIFVGENSKTWNKANAAKAVELEKAGATPEDIWSATGTFRGPEGKLRQEISDKNSKITDDVFEGIKANQEFKGPASQALTHPELYAAYPDVAKIESGLFANAIPEGSYHVPTDTILAGGPSTGAQRSAMLHELQHAIQQREGFIGGASPTGPYPAGVREQIIKDQFEQLKAFNKYDPSNPYSSPNVASDEELLKKAIRNTDEIGGVGRMDAYRRSAGEAEARAVQKRMNMTDEERRSVFPYESYDVKPNNLIIKNAGDVAQSTNGLRESRKTAPTALPQENALKLAQQRAALPVDQGGLGLPKDNTPDMRAAAMGFDVNNPLYHATDVDFASIRPSLQGKLGAGVYVSPSSQYAEKYTSLNAAGNARVLPLVARGKLADDDVAMNIAESIRQEMFAQNPNFSVAEWKKRTTKALSDAGYDGRNMSGLESVITDPSNVRSRFAAFDPFRKTAATAAAMGVAAPDLLAQDKNQLRKGR